MKNEVALCFVVLIIHPRFNSWYGISKHLYLISMCNN